MRDDDTRDLDLRPRLPALLLGFLAAAFERYLLRDFSAEVYGHELTFGFFLGSWLLWGGLGSLARPGAARGASSGRLYGLYCLAILLFFLSLVALRFSHSLLGILPAELTGLVPALGFALVLSFLLSFPLGHYFVLNAGLLGGDASLVYLLESAGAAVAGLVVHFLLIPKFSNWEGAALIGAGASILILAAMKPGRSRWLVAAAIVFAACLAAFDLPSQKEVWKPLRLVEAKDTPYGKLQVIKTGEQVTLFDNGLAVFSQPDAGAAEESVHFALLQRDGVRDVLLIGGGASGGAAEALKYPGVRLDYVELDPAIIRLSEKHLAAADFAALRDPRVRIVYQDGRTFLERTSERYDAIILNLPEPATAQVNRYYTREFFLEARKKLNPGGVLGFIVPSAENYIGEELAQFLGCLDATLRSVFPEVVAVPGSNCVFLASEGPLSIDPGRLTAAIVGLGLNNRFVSPEMLPARLNPLRVDYLAGRISGRSTKINLDLVPVSYYFHSILWSAQFRGLESKLLQAAGRIRPGLLLDAPLAVFALGLAFLALLRKRSAARFLVPIAVMGLTSIVVELVVFIAFQANFGYVYGKLPLLLALFMAGLVVGSLLARRQKGSAPAALPIVQGAFVLALLAALKSLSGAGGEIFPFVLLFVFGGLGGYLFVCANRLLLRVRPHQGLGYGIDLLASFAGVALASAVIIPLWGLPAILIRLVILNAICFAYLLATSSSRS
ncbi:MAG: methyltransferase [Candidatus Aminicenantes bacterium]|nr:methyltransferase [Candidatus Aminicenantes bacterium]